MVAAAYCPPRHKVSEEGFGLLMDSLCSKFIITCRETRHPNMERFGVCGTPIL